MLGFIVCSRVMSQCSLTLTVECEEFVPSVSLSAGGSFWKITFHLL